MQCSYQYTGTTQRAREILPPLLDAGRDIATEEEEEAEVMNAFLASVFGSKSGCSPRTRPPELEGGDGERKKAPVNQEEMALRWA